MRIDELEKRLRTIEERLIGVEAHQNVDSETRHEIYENLRMSIQNMNGRVNALLCLFISTIVALVAGAYFLMSDVATINANLTKIGERVTQNQLRLEEKVNRATEAAEQALEQ